MTTLMTALFDDFDRHPIPRDSLQRWSTRYPALAASTAELVTNAASWHHARGDAMLIPLHRLAAGGEPRAARLILVAPTPRLAAVARRRHDDRVEIVDELIGYLFEAVVAPHPPLDGPLRRPARARRAARPATPTRRSARSSHVASCKLDQTSGCESRPGKRRSAR